MQSYLSFQCEYCLNSIIIDYLGVPLWYYIFHKNRSTYQLYRFSKIYIIYWILYISNYMHLSNIVVFTKYTPYTLYSEVFYFKEEYGKKIKYFCLFNCKNFNIRGFFTGMKLLLFKNQKYIEDHTLRIIHWGLRNI